MDNNISSNNGLLQGNQVLESPEGNYMARTNTRWELASGINRKNRSVSRSNSNLNQDSVHEPIENIDDYAPGQLYSTESKKLFHAGKILIVLVGLPATSKTLLSVAITRYSRWLGVRADSFHASEYRKSYKYLPEDYFSAAPKTKEGKKFNEEFLDSILNDISHFFEKGNGQMAIYDGLNIRKKDRKYVMDRFLDTDVKVLYIESLINDTQIIQNNIKIASNSPDFKGLPREKAEELYTHRLEINKPLFEDMTKEEEICYVKFINLGERIVVNNAQNNYLINKIVFFLMNLRTTKNKIFFARCGRSDEDKFIDDEQLNEEGIEYAKKLTELVIDLVKDSKEPTNAEPLKHFQVFTAERKRTSDTAKFFSEEGIRVTQRSELRQLIPGVVADLTEAEIKTRYPDEYAKWCLDPYHFRYPRAESYHDLSVRMEPLLLEMERTGGDILIIAHESTLRVLYGYFMASTCLELTQVDFTRDEILEISFTPFQNHVRRIPVETD